MGVEYYFHELYGDLQSHMGKVKAAQMERLKDK